MKNISSVILLLLLSVSGFAQEPCEDMSVDSVKKATLHEAKLMNELMPAYPQEYYNTIIDYVSVEILTTCSGKPLTAVGTNEVLTTEQKNNLKMADIGSKIYIKIKFKYKDPKNDNMGSGRKIKEMEFKVKASTTGKNGLQPCKGC